MTTLEDLRRAIELIPARTGPKDLRAWEDYFCRTSKAWRAAFEWYSGLIERHGKLSDESSHLTDWIAIDREEDEGMAIIERLKCKSR